MTHRFFCTDTHAKSNTGMASSTLSALHMTQSAFSTEQAQNKHKPLRHTGKRLYAFKKVSRPDGLSLSWLQHNLTSVRLTKNLSMPLFCILFRLLSLERRFIHSSIGTVAVEFSQAQKLIKNLFPFKNAAL